MRASRLTICVCLALSTALLLDRAHAQTDAPPELDHAIFSELPPLDQPAPQLEGTLTLELSGVSAMDEAKVREELARQVENVEQFGLDAASAYDTAYYTELIYRKQGHAGVEVTEEILGPWTLRLRIQEGSRIRVGEVSMTGNQAYETAQLREYLLGPTKERFPEIREELDLPYVAKEVETGADLVRRLYRAEGYLDAVVSEPQVTISTASQRADIRLNINEGRRYTFGEIRFEGELLFSRAELLKEIAEEIKDAFTDGRVAALQRKLTDFYKKRGYFKAEITAMGDSALAVGGKVPVLVSVQAGELHYYDGVSVSGNEGVSTDFLEKRFARLKGRAYDPARTDRQFRRLIETGLFRTVNIDPESIEGNQVRLNLHVEEAPPKEFGVGAGFATHEGGIFTASYANKNLWGSGRPFNTELGVSGRGYSGEIAYRDPWFRDTNFELNLRGYALTRELEGYSKQEFGFEPSISRRVSRYWRFSAFLRLEYVKLRDVLIEPYELVGPDEYTTLTLGLSQTYDRRNNRTLPTSGYYFTNSLEYAPAAFTEVSFIRSSTQLSVYVPVTRRSHLALGARAHLVKPLEGGSENLPIDERVFNGGATTVRSFRELYLGPKDENGEYPIGGETALILNAEYTFPLVKDFQGAVFFDAGNVMPVLGDFSTSEMRYAIGAGVRYNLPIGSLRLDYGVNPSPKAGESEGAFHFAIGVAF